MSKRIHEDDGDNESDDDFGPMPISNPVIPEKPLKKKSNLSSHLKSLYLENLPNSIFYEYSYMHRDIITHIAISKATEFIITASYDGHVKFWKKMMDSIEFVKHFQAHLEPINALTLSYDGYKLVTTSNDKMIKFFEVVGFDMSHMINTNTFIPTCAVWLETDYDNQVAIGDQSNGIIRIYNSNGGSSIPIKEILKHSSPVTQMSFNFHAKCIISIDTSGLIEYWDTSSYSLPNKNHITFAFKSETDLYELMKAKTTPYSLSISPNGKRFVILSKDKKIRVFHFSSGKLARVYNESCEIYDVSLLVLVLVVYKLILILILIPNT